MDAIEICYRLRRSGYTQRAVATELNVSISVVGNVIHDRVTAHAVATFIAQKIGVSVQELWPQRYVFKPRGASARRGHGTADGSDGKDLPKG
ncbi:helix-turn-helix domain-containing protein [Roseateles violae]|uniref:Helix-turn-helix domain-containing protein n=1 Tax=Roseateles violae TaxID=3058042 RepID=A0ABT8DWS8_9BURK|nr:helix-turn-helix domain-containing protein [Pelomonas sp. PFR6]MDN3922518.1 helix-turn-helix domain-containing protein [Pelomonas sp. PFR6]